METKVCPHCGKEIQKEAILCKYCPSLLVEQSDDEEDTPANGDTIIFKKAEKPEHEEPAERVRLDDYDDEEEEEFERKERRAPASRRRVDDDDDDEYEYDDDDDDDDDDDKKRLYIMVLVIAVGIIVVAIVCLAVATKLFGNNDDSGKITVKNTAPAIATSEEPADSANTDEESEPDVTKATNEDGTPATTTTSSIIKEDETTTTTTAEGDETTTTTTTAEGDETTTTTTTAEGDETTTTSATEPLTADQETVKSAVASQVEGDITSMEMWSENETYAWYNVYTAEHGYSVAYNKETGETKVDQHW